MVESAVTADVVAERIRPAFAHRDVTALRPLFAPEARWGNCLGGEEILAWMQQAQAEGLETTLLDIEAHPDRVVVALQLQGTRDDATSPAAPQTYYLIAFVADGQIIELRDAADREEARRAMASVPRRVRWVPAARSHPPPLSSRCGSSPPP
jgi:hypothetical protein